MNFWIFYECSNITDFDFWNLDLHLKKMHYNNISYSKDNIPLFFVSTSKQTDFLLRKFECEW